ncbi:hypothetical protein ABU553_004006 [Yersinia enterocolitica]
MASTKKPNYSAKVKYWADGVTGECTRPIILRHYEKIKPLGYKLAWLLFAIGVLNGQFKWNR